MAQKSSSKTKKARYEAYTKEGRQAKNKATKIARHKRLNPNDKTVTGTVPNYTSKKAKVYDFGASYAKQSASSRTRRR